MISPDVVPRRQRYSIPKRLTRRGLYGFSLYYPKQIHRNLLGDRQLNDPSTSRNIGQATGWDDSYLTTGAMGLAEFTIARSSEPTNRGSLGTDLAEDVADVGLGFGERGQT